MTPTFRSFTATHVPEEQLAHCASLFSEHYGVWGQQADRPGTRIKMISRLLRNELLFNEQCHLVAAYSNEELIGHAMFTRFRYERVEGENIAKPRPSVKEAESDTGTIVWITQLVVHHAHREKGVATDLIRNAYDKKTDVAAGLVTSHPYAVRAFEKATGHSVVPSTVQKSDVTSLLRASEVPYLQGKRTSVSSDHCTIDTKFFADHSEVNEILNKKGPDWLLGPLNEGEEFLAIVSYFAPDTRVSRNF